MKKYNTIFMGTPDFSVPSLELLHNHPLIDLKYVISQPDRPKGRGQQASSPEVINFAKANKISFFQTENINREDEFYNRVADERIDIIVVLAFAQFLGSKWLGLPSIGCFNIHTSLLPKYRGAAPIQYALLNGDNTSGVSIQKMVKKMDAGDLAISTPMNIAEFENGGLLYTRLKLQAALSLNELISNIYSNTLQFNKQNENNVSFAPTLKREDGHIKFANQSSESIINAIRALDPWPGTYCFLNNKRLKIFNACISNAKLKAGEVSTRDSQLIIGTTNGSIELLDVQLEGKKRISVRELLNGIREDITIG